MDRAGIQQLVTTTEARVAHAWAAAVQQLRAANPVTELAARLHSANAVAGLTAAIGAFADAERDAYLSAGRATMRWIGGELAKPEHVEPVAKKILTFDADAEADAWAATNRIDRITGLSDEVRTLVREMLRRGTERGVNPRVIAREIRDAIGLTPAQEQIVANYRAQLEAGQLADALHRELSSGTSDRAIAAALRARSALTPAQIDLAVERYRANFIALRAETIARTEAQRIAHQASDNAFRQAIRRNDLDAEQLECEWLHSPTAKRTKDERAFHVSMHGQKRAWGEPFESGLGNLLLFPGDPNAPAKETLNCRCGRTVRIRPAARRANAA
jgi:hypothetical protein